MAAESFRYTDKQLLQELGEHYERVRDTMMYYGWLHLREVNLDVMTKEDAAFMRDHLRVVAETEDECYLYEQSQD